MKKGQMFVIAAIFMLLALVFLSNLLGTHLLTEERQFQEKRVGDKIAKNIMNEYKIASGIATTNGPINAVYYLQNMSNFYKDNFDGKILYYFASANGTNQRITIIVGNFADERINFTVNSTGSTPLTNSAIIQDGSSSVFDFAAINGTTNISISYASIDGLTVEKFVMNVSTKNFVVGLFDISIIEEDFIVRDKDTFWRVWQ